MRGLVLSVSAVVAAGGIVLLTLHGGAPVGGHDRIAQVKAFVPPVAQEPSPTALLGATAVPVGEKVGSKPVLVIGSYQQVLVNHDRAGAHLGPLSWNSCLLAVAISNARRMAAQGYISHTNGAWQDLGCHLGAQGGENVGWWSGGVNDALLNSMFVASPDHLANILGPYHYIATAWAVGSHGYGYVAVEFA